jgi:3-oxoacyl-[acyl-carrier-protein] synthase-3
MKQYAKILGTGSYLPPRVMSNQDFEKMIETSDEWIFSRSGIRNRHFVDGNEGLVDIAEVAARRAIEASGISPNDIDGIIIGTTSGDYVFPSAACDLQARLGITNTCAAFDIQAACSGFIYALSVAEKFMKTGAMRCVLVIGGEVISNYINWEDRTTSVLFGDGAGAVVLGLSDEPGIMSTHIHADGRYRDLLYAKHNWKETGKVINRPFIVMEGKEVFKVAVNTLNDMVEEALVANNLEKTDIDWLVPHQANLRIIAATAKKLDLPMERVIVTVQEQGNTSAGSIPLALDEGVRDGRIKRGELLLLEAFGGGFTWGSALIRY